MQANMPNRRVHRPTRAPLVAFPLWTLFLWTGPACQGFADQGQPVMTAYGLSRGAELLQVETGDFHGLSDLTHTSDAEGRPTYWAIPEQQRALVQLNLTSEARPTLEPKPRPILGIDDDFDTESVTSLGGGRFAIGTETMQSKRPIDTIFIVAGAHARDIDRGPLYVTDTLAMPYKLWPGLSARRNEGLEGICAAGNVLLASSETVGKLPSGDRYAPLGRFDFAEGQWVPYAMALTLPTGRLSAIQCRLSASLPGYIEVVAVERHYGVGRILHAWLPVTPNVDNCQEPQVLFPEVLVDLAPMLTPLINFEGIDWLPNGDLMLLTDNYMGFVRGPTFILKLPKT